MELFTPIFLIWVLSAALNLSDVTTYPPETYSTLNITFSGNTFGFLGVNGNATLNAVSNNNEASNSSSSSSSIDAIWKEFEKRFKEPLPIPSIDEFVSMSNVLTENIVNGDEYEYDEFVANSEQMRRWGNLISLGTLHISAHDDAVTEEFVEYLNATTSSFDGITDSTTNSSSLLVRTHSNEGDALEFVMDHLEERAWAVIHFDKTEVEDFQFTIRMNYTTLPNTSRVSNYVAKGLDPDYRRYYLSGYMTLQHVLSSFALIHAGNDAGNDNCNPLDSGDVWSIPMPTPFYSQNAFYVAAGFLLGLAIAMGFLYPTSRLVKSIVEEKESRMKETLLILGVKKWTHWISWVITAYISFVFIAIVMTVISSRSLLSHSSPVYVFFYYLFFCSSVIGFSFFLSVFFSKAKLAGIIAPVALFASILPKWIFFSSNRYEATAEKRWASLLPATAFAFGADILSDYEYAEIGVHSWNASEGKYSFNLCLRMMFFDTFIYMVLAWYLEQVLPSQYGISKPFYFPVSSLFRYIRKKISSTSNANISSNEESVDVEDTDRERFERIDDTFTTKVRTSNLTKYYHGMDRAAVDNLNIEMQESQITCLLGHNGAGKSTTINMLTGLYPPSKGDCLIYDNHISSELDAIRQCMSICPQHSVLFEDLTVAEHISFFTRIKGILPSKEYIQERAAEVGLGEKLDTASKHLSGGMKRKLSVAIAFCGDPKFVLLDEPTSGMDPISRRSMWDLLRRVKMGRTILLTTHFMDEADVLADRIAIMSAGCLECFGSSVFLKNRFGLGYNLKIVLCSISDEITSTTLVEGSENRQRRIWTYLKRSVDSIELVGVSGKELSFRVPFASESSIPALLDSIENEEALNTLGIESYGVSITSLEEVFVNLAAEKENDICLAAVKDIIPNNNDDASINRKSENEICCNESPEEIDLPRQMPRLTAPKGVVGVTRQITILLWKRYITQVRDPKGTFFIIAVPVLLISLVLAILTIEIHFAGPPLNLNLALYERSISGEKGSTSIPIGGGAAVGAVDNSSAIISTYDEFKAFMSEDYPRVDFQLIGNVSSSVNMSDYLLETYNFRNHHDRFGSYVFDDRIDAYFNIDWQNTSMDDLYSLVDFTSGSASGSSAGSGTFELALLLGFGIKLGDSSTIPNEDTVLQPEIFTKATIIHNSSSAHGIAAYNQAYSEYLYKGCTENIEAKLSSVNHPLPLTTKQSTEVLVALSVLASLFLLIPLGYIPAAFSVYLVKERSCKSKHLQLVSGVDMTSFWISTYVWDMILYCILIVLVMIVFMLFGRESTTRVFVGDSDTALATFLLMLSYGFSSLPFAYIFSRFFVNHSTAQISILGLLFLTGFIAVTIQFILSNIESTEYIADGLRPLFELFPAYNVGDGFLKLADFFFASVVLSDDSSPLDWDVSGRPICYMFGMSIPYFSILLLLECSQVGGAGGMVGRWVRRARAFASRSVLRMYGETFDSDSGELIPNDGGSVLENDILDQHNLISEQKETMVQTSKVLAYNLWKIYPPSIGYISSFCTFLRAQSSCCRKNPTSASEWTYKPKKALRGVSLSINTGETFGLLGKNGAGKTTFLGILTGEIISSGGEAFVASHNVTGLDSDGVALSRKHIGFCPQEDPLLEKMTGRETLEMFGKLRGIRNDDLTIVVNDLLMALTLAPYADKVVEGYSGGNKRKLSLGCALIGDPQVLFIDEASSGVDPVSRRKLWNLLSMIAVDRSIIITTHSMEEAEALCTRIGIIVNGQMTALGSVQHLKSKILDGYIIDIQCASDAPLESLNMVKAHVKNAIERCELDEQHGRFLRFSVKRRTTLTRTESSESSTAFNSYSLSKIFKTLLEAKANPALKIQDYLVSQCSLEQVFVHLAEGESDATDVE